MPQRPVNPDIRQNPLSYAQRLESRCTDDIKLLVIHCTELPDMPMARTWGEKTLYPETRTGNSGHFYIDRDGEIEQWIPVNRIAHHVRGFNPQSIGVELVNTGRYPDWFKAEHQKMSEPYPDSQIEALLALTDHLQALLPCLEYIAGHEDLDTGMIASEDRPDLMIKRKLDPGIHFPWPLVLRRTSLSRFLGETP